MSKKGDENTPSPLLLYRIIKNLNISAFNNSQLSTQKSFPFFALTLLRRLFLLLARHSLQAPSALASCIASVFHSKRKLKTQKSFPFSALRFPFFAIFAVEEKQNRL